MGTVPVCLRVRLWIDVAYMRALNVYSFYSVYIKGDYKQNMVYILILLIYFFLICVKYSQIYIIDFYLSRGVGVYFGNPNRDPRSVRRAKRISIIQQILR